MDVCEGSNCVEEGKVINQGCVLVLGDEPRLNQVFDKEEYAYEFYCAYARRVGFNVRREYANKNRTTNAITSRRFVCTKEGYKDTDKRGEMRKKVRTGTRTGCLARLSISRNRTTGKYIVHEFNDDHNHPFHFPICSSLMLSGKRSPEGHAVHADSLDDSTTSLKASFEDNGSTVDDGRTSITSPKFVKKNYLRTRRKRDMDYGEAGSLLRYFQQRSLEDPLFNSAIQFDYEEKMTNVFWADAKMVVDYLYFGDVVNFDATFNLNKEVRPFGVFTGLNHHGKTVIFGAAFIYDESLESFLWLFETFLEVHKHKYPKTIFTNQDISMETAINAVMPNTYHGFSTFHIMQNALQHLTPFVADVNSLLQLFTDFLYDCEEDDFYTKCQGLIKNNHLEDSPWLNETLTHKHKWVKAFMKNAFTMRMRALHRESVISDIKGFLLSKHNLVQFFHQFDRILNEKRYDVLKVECKYSQKLPIIKIRAPMLLHACEIYTSFLFELFQTEYEEYESAIVENCIEIDASNRYKVAIYGTDKLYDVLATSDANILTCSCRKFETVGILCCHIMKVLDAMKIKIIPEKYILKRWTKMAKTSISEDMSGAATVEDIKLEASSRYRSLWPDLVKLACIAADSLEATELVAKVTSQLMKEVNEIRLRHYGGNQEEIQGNQVEFSDKSTR